MSPFCSRWMSRRYSAVIVSSGELSEVASRKTPEEKAAMRHAGGRSVERRASRALRRRCEREEERLEAEGGRAHVAAASRPSGAAPAGPQEQRDARAEREELLDLITIPASCWSVTAEIPYAPGTPDRAA